MKILLTAVNAKYIHSNLAVYSLKAYARAYESSIEIAEYTINQHKDEILEGLFRKRPDVLCFSCYIWNISFIRDIISDIHKILPETVIWVGGPEVSYDAEEFLLECTDVTGVMAGEGEAAFLELVRHYVDKDLDLDSIGGILYRKGETICRTFPREILDLSTVPFPYDSMDTFAHKIIYYETSRGCPFSCSYCLSSIDKKLRFRSLDLVKKELQFFIDRKVPQVKFVDRTFNCSHEHSLTVWRYLDNHDNGVTNFHFEIAADLLSEEELDLISAMRPGLIQLEIGVQSTNLQTLKAIQRKMEFDKVACTVKKLNAGKNVHQHLDLIVGLPFETYESFQQSFNDVYALAPEQLQLGFLKVLKGSLMHKKVQEYQCKYQVNEPYEVLSNRWLAYGDILKLKGIEDMVEVYYNSGQFSYTLSAAVRMFESPFHFYETLALFYEEHGYRGVSHTRVRRYDILLEFLQNRLSACGQPGNMLDVYKELLVFDLYIRENIKSRPVWAKEIPVHKEFTRVFYQKEEEQRFYLKDYMGYQAKQLSKMTHLEAFSYEVMKEINPGVYDKREVYYLLFDYKNRNPLTYDAAVHVVEN